MTKISTFKSPWCRQWLGWIIVLSPAVLTPAPLLPPVSAQQISTSQAKRTILKLRKLDQPLEAPEPGQWLANHRERGQTFVQYVKIRPNVLTPRRQILYVQPIGQLNSTEQRIVDATREYLGVYFNCQTRVLPRIEAEAVPPEARRSPDWGGEQWQTRWILEKLLAPGLPEDAFATIAFTNQDLWPGEGWNFVFGYAAFRDRVGVWSLHRFGDPDRDEAAYRVTLKRTIKLATHETGHMFSMQHCTHARCNMQGSNSLAESDEQPMHLCSQCHAKTLWATGSDPVKRLQTLKKLCEKHGFDDEVKHYQRAIDLLAGADSR